MRPFLAIVAAAGLVPAGARAGPSLALNGVPIDGAVSQRIENATVIIDERGNVNIVASGYAVDRPRGESAGAETTAAAAQTAAGQAVAARAAAALTRRYFVAATQTEPGATEYDVSVFLNGRWVREVRSDAEAEPFELTRFLRPGPNKVQLVAAKRAGATRRSTSAGSTLRVVIGEGSGAAGAAAVEAPLVEMIRNASEVETFTEEHILVAR